MRILYVVQHFSGPAGSSGSRAYENARRLVSKGHSVTLLCGRYESASEADILAAKKAGIDIRQSSVAYKQKMGFLPRLLAFRGYMKWALGEGKKTIRPDIVFASSTPLTMGEIGRLLARHHKCPFVFEVRDVWPEVPESLGLLRNPYLRWSAYRMARRIYEAADHIVALSPDMKGMVGKWGVKESDISVIPNCSDTRLFGGHELRNETRDQYGWDGKFVCIHPGAMGVVNGLDYMLDCAKELDRLGHDDILIALVGSGNQRVHLGMRIKREGIQSAMLYDSVKKADMPRLLSAADLGLVTVLNRPYLSSNSANKFFDYLAAGLPVAINYGGWQAEVLKDSRAGVAADESDPSDMARLLVYLRDNPEKRKQMGEAARSLAVVKFDRDILVASLEQLLREVSVGVRGKSASE